MIALPLLLALAAFVAFALATDRHHRQRFGRPCSPGTARLLRGGAWVLLALGLVVSVAVRGPVFGPIVWSGTAMIGAAIVFLALNLR